MITKIAERLSHVFRVRALVPEVALRKKTSWAWASMMRLRVPTVSGEMSMVGSLFRADSTVSLMWPNAPLASCRKTRRGKK